MSSPHSFRNSLFLVFCLSGCLGVSAQKLNTNFFSINPIKLGYINEEAKPEKKSCCGQPENSVETFTLIGSYYSLKNGQETILMFNNKGPQLLIVTPVFFSLSGVRLDLPAITIPAKSYQEYDVRYLLAGHLPQYKEGSLQVSHQGGRLQLGAQFKILKGGMIFDEQFIQPVTRFPSNRLESVWWLPSTEAETKFIISNTTDAPVITTITVDGTLPHQAQPATIQLNAHETRVLDIINDLVGENTGEVKKDGGISIIHNGTAGAIMARILVSEPANGYSSVMNFTDPTTPLSSRLNGGGLRIGSIGTDDLKPIVVARNIGTETTTVSGKIPYTDANGEVAFVTIPAIQIAPGKTKHINLRQEIQAANIPASVTFAGIDLEYSTAPGTVLMNALSVSQSGQHVFQVPLLDPERLPSSAGGFPWKVDGDYTTVIFVKNESDVPKKYIANLTYEGGTYSLGVRELKPWQTVMVDFKQLRDTQTPDLRGHIIPLNVERGQTSWTMFGTTNKKMSGRSEQVNTVIGISSTYACYNCCPDSYVIDGVIPGTTEEEVGGTITYLMDTHLETCYGVQDSIPIYGQGWLTSNASVATITNDGLAEAIAPGDAFFTVEWTSRRWFLQQQDLDCQFEDIPGSGTGEMEVRPNVDIDEFLAVGKGLSRNINVTVENNNSSSNITLNLIKTSGTGSATFADNTTTKIITQTTSVEIKGVTESSAKDNLKLEAKWTSQNNNTRTLADESFSVLWVTLALRTSGSVTTDNAARLTFQASQGTTNLGTYYSDGSDPHFWHTGVEVVGTVAPSNFTGNIVLRRFIMQKLHFDNQTQFTVPFTNPDTSQPVFRDDNPQSGNSGGKVYDLDAPGIGTDETRPANFILRDRTNFRQYATFTEDQQEMKVSANFPWFSRISIQKHKSGDVLYTDVNNDNMAGEGATNVTWNLEPPSFTSGETEMKRTIPLIVALTITPICENPIFVYGQTATNNCPITKKNEDTEKLLAVIRDKNLVETDRAKVIQAIDKLGELKATEAIEDLVGLLTLDRGAKYFDKENPPSGGIISASSIYPAVQALYRIGEPAVPALIKVIENEKSDALASKNAHWVILTIYREEPGDAVKLLKEAADKSLTIEGKERLFEAAKKFEDLIEKLKK
jgi:hypothetical protein